LLYARRLSVFGDSTAMNEKQELPETEEEKENSKPNEVTLALELEKKRSEEYLTRLRYAHADLENMKKRFDRQIEDIKKHCSEPLVMELLEVVDELEMAIKSGQSSDSAQALTRGVEITLKKLRKTLENEGVYSIDSLGKPFDPSKHTAVARIEREDVDNCTVIEEVRKGYIMKEKVIRPSIVKVAVKPSSESQAGVCPNE
jgi:molecular chaperone GrpE